MAESDERHATVRLPIELCDKADALVEKRWRGYRSRAEFFADAGRRLIDQAEKAGA